MRSWVLLLTGLLLVSVPVFAAPGMDGHSVQPAGHSGSVDANVVNSPQPSVVRAHGHGKMPALPERFVEKLRHRGIDVNSVMQRAREQREQSKMMLHNAREREMAAHQHVLAFRQMATGVRETALQYRQQRQKFLQIREEYLRGEVNTDEYFSAAKQFVLSAIDLALDRLNLAKSESPESLQPKIVQEINTLQQLRTEVMDVNDLNALRAIYPQVRSAVVTANNQVFARVYYWGLLNATDAVLARLDVASARLAAVVDDAKANGTYSPTIDANVTAVFAQIDSLRADVNALRQDVLTGDVNDFHSIGEQLKQIRMELREVYHEISVLIKETRRVQPTAPRQVQSRVEANAAVEVNA